MEKIHCVVSLTPPKNVFESGRLAVLIPTAMKRRPAMVLEITCPRPRWMWPIIGLTDACVGVIPPIADPKKLSEAKPVKNGTVRAHRKKTVSGLGLALAGLHEAAVPSDFKGHLTS